MCLSKRLVNHGGTQDINNKIQGITPVNHRLHKIMISIVKLIEKDDQKKLGMHI